MPLTVFCMMLEPMTQLETSPLPARAAEGALAGNEAANVSPWQMVGEFTVFDLYERARIYQSPHALEATQGVRDVVEAFVPNVGVRMRRNLADDACIFFGLPPAGTKRSEEGLFDALLVRLHETYSMYLRKSRLPLSAGSALMLSLLGGTERKQQPMPFSYYWDQVSDSSSMPRSYIHGMLLNDLAQFTRWYAERANGVPPHRPITSRLLEIQSIPWHDIEQWRGYGECAGLYNDEFFDAKTLDDERRLTVLYCGGCVVREQCLAFGLETDEPYMVWGGTLPRTRNKMLGKTSKTPKGETATQET